MGRKATVIGHFVVAAEGYLMASKLVRSGKTTEVPGGRKQEGGSGNVPEAPLLEEEVVVLVVAEVVVVVVVVVVVEVA